MNPHAVLLSLVVALVTIAGQDPAKPPKTPEPQQQPPVFRSGAELVRVDATVIDGNGHPVTTLTADDFVVEEDGVRQKIQSFRLMRLDGLLAEGEDRPLEIRYADQAAAEAGRDDVRVFLLFWDEYHILPDYTGVRLRNEIVKFLRTMVAPTDLVAIMDEWTPMSHLRFTRDIDALVVTASSLKGRQGLYTPPRNVAEENHLQGRNAAALRNEVSISALRSAMLHMMSLRQGRTALLYFGREFTLGRDTFKATLDLIDAANAANIAFYSISPDGLDVRGRRYGILSDLALNTGGEALPTNAPEVAIRRIVTQAGAYYLLGYVPEPLRRDGKFHKISVKVRKGGLHVRARQGYWAPTTEEITRAREKAEAGVVQPEIVAAFGELARLGYGPTEPVAVRTIARADGPDARLTIPAPVVWCVKRASDLRDVLGASPPPPHEGREFTRTDRLIVRLSVAGAAATSAELSAKLLDRQGKVLTALPVRREAEGWLLDLPLSSIARGDYVIAFEARAGADGAATYLPVRITAG